MASPTLYGRIRLNGFAQILPQAAPSSKTVVAPSDALLLSLTITNTTTGALTFTLADQQAVPVVFLDAVSIAANTTVLMVFSKPEGEGAPLYLPGGFTVQASNTGLNYWAAWEQ